MVAAGADNLGLYSAERRLEKKKNAVFIVSYIINQCMWWAYMTPTVQDNCLQLCIWSSILRANVAKAWAKLEMVIKNFPSYFVRS